MIGSKTEASDGGKNIGKNEKRSVLSRQLPGQEKRIIEFGGKRLSSADGWLFPVRTGQRTELLSDQKRFSQQREEGQLKEVGGGNAEGGKS